MKILGNPEYEHFFVLIWMGHMCYILNIQDIDSPIINIMNGDILV